MFKRWADEQRRSGGRRSGRATKERWADERWADEQQRRTSSAGGPSGEVEERWAEEDRCRWVEERRRALFASSPLPRSSSALPLAPAPASARSMAKRRHCSLTPAPFHHQLLPTVRSGQGLRAQVPRRRSPNTRTSSDGGGGRGHREGHHGGSAIGGAFGGNGGGVGPTRRPFERLRNRTRPSLASTSPDTSSRAGSVLASSSRTPHSSRACKELLCGPPPAGEQFGGGAIVLLLLLRPRWDHAILDAEPQPGAPPLLLRRGVSKEVTRPRLRAHHACQVTAAATLPAVVAHQATGRLR
ncbi:hypothetical protein ABZP36_020401 [Zizania latifolia]